MSMVEVLTGIGKDEYDEIYAHVFELTPIFHLPDEIRKQLLYAFGDLAKQCRNKDKEIKELSAIIEPEELYNAQYFINDVYHNFEHMPLKVIKKNIVNALYVLNHCLPKKEGESNG